MTATQASTSEFDLFGPWIDVVETPEDPHIAVGVDRRAVAGDVVAAVLAVAGECRQRG